MTAYGSDKAQTSNQHIHYAITTGPLDKFNRGSTLLCRLGILMELLCPHTAAGYSRGNGTRRASHQKLPKKILV